MAQVTIEFDMNTSAFLKDGAEVAKVLSRALEEIESEPPSGCLLSELRDTDGTIVGFVRIDD